MPLPNNICDNPNNTCHNCQSSMLRLFPAFSVLKRVTSDCRPWPEGGQKAQCTKCGLVQSLVTQAWRDECAQIYDQYSLYYQSNGVEQPIFSADKAAASRSDLLLDRVKELSFLPKNGSALDIGCGNGSFLRSLSGKYPDWRLMGVESGRRYEEVVRSIPGVENFYFNGLNDVSESFDFISLVHVLEHIDDPVSFLRSVRERLKPGGLLLIQLPNFLENPFDLLVADHASHFTVDTISSVLEMVKIHSISIRANTIRKEITVLASLDHSEEAISRSQLNDSVSDNDVVNDSVDLLLNMRNTAISHRDAGDRVIVFGTSNGGTWLANELDMYFEAFVDEDISRIGTQHLGIPILNPTQLEVDMIIVIPLAEGVVKPLITRLPKVKSVISVLKKSDQYV